MQNLASVFDLVVALTHSGLEMEATELSLSLLGHRNR